MCKVYLYSRVSTSQQTLAQQERTAYEWLNAHNMKVDEVVSDEGISGGVSYKDRNLGKVLLPKMVEGDMIIVSEISRLGRSMFDLSKLIHTELKPRKVRLVVCNMGIDLNCSKMTAIDELILNNFSFAAQLEKQLISERTLSALEVKRKQGVKFGRASEKYKLNYNNKPQEEKERENMERGKMKSLRFIEARDQQVFMKVLKKVFPECTNGDDIRKWNWEGINCKPRNSEAMRSVMAEYKELDGNLFRKWDFTNEYDSRKRLITYVYTIKRSLFKK